MTRRHELLLQRQGGNLAPCDRYREVTFPREIIRAVADAGFHRRGHLQAFARTLHARSREDAAAARDAW